MVIEQADGIDWSSEELDWETFLRELRIYVQLELAGEVDSTTYPVLAFHIRTSPECQRAYYHELRQQSLALAIAAQQNNQMIAERTLLRQLLGTTTQLPTVVVKPSWVEQTINHGKGWLEAGSNRWHQLQIFFSDLQLLPTAAPAFRGTMSEAHIHAEQEIGEIHVTPTEANFELAITVSPEPDSKNKSLYKIEVMVTLFERIGDYSGVELTLYAAKSGDDLVKHAITDELGRASFHQISGEQIHAMSLLVSLPN